MKILILGGQGMLGHRLWINLRKEKSMKFGLQYAKPLPHFLTARNFHRTTFVQMWMPAILIK